MDVGHKRARIGQIIEPVVNFLDRSVVKHFVQDDPDGRFVAVIPVLNFFFSDRESLVTHMRKRGNAEQLRPVRGFDGLCNRGLVFSSRAGFEDLLCSGLWLKAHLRDETTDLDD